MGRKAKRLRLFKIQEEIQEKKMTKQREVTVTPLSIVKL